MNYLILGAGGFAREVASLLKFNWEETDEIGTLAMSVDRDFHNLSFPLSESVGAKVVVISEANKDYLHQYDYVFAGVGNPTTRIRLLSKTIKIFESKYPGEPTDKVVSRIFPALISRDLIANRDTVKVGKGSIICQGCIITTHVEIGEFSIVNIGCRIGHDVKIGDCVTIAPSCNLMGGVKIEDEVELGTAVTCIPNVRIGKGSVIGAGAVVTKDIPEKCLAVGIPAKVIKDFACQ